MLTLGIIFGVATAALQAIAYLLSRILFGRGFPLIKLLAMGHVVMAVAAGPVLVAVWRADMPGPAVWLWPVVGTVGGYLIGQCGLFYALRHTEASRVAPLLGLKIVMLAVLAVTLLDLPLSPEQWVAVVIATAAAFVLNHTGGSIPVRALAAILVTCLFYSFSDLMIVQLVDAVQLDDGRVVASIRATAMAYVFLGVVALPLLPWLGSRKLRDWKAVLPYAAAWLGSMFCMFAAIGLVQVVLANILQSTRGIIAVVLGAIVAKIGHVHLEQRTTRAVLVRRVVAATLMTVAVALYVIGKQR